MRKEDASGKDDLKRGKRELGTYKEGYEHLEELVVFLRTKKQKRLERNRPRKEFRQYGRVETLYFDLISGRQESAICGFGVSLHR